MPEIFHPLPPWAPPFSPSFDQRAHDSTDRPAVSELDSRNLVLRGLAHSQGIIKSVEWNRGHLLLRRRSNERRGLLAGTMRMIELPV